MESAAIPDLDGLEPLDAGPPDYLERNRSLWEELAPMCANAGRNAWAADELRWGLWATPESELCLLDGSAPGEDAIELGCGAAAICSWLARRGMRPVGVDISQSQLRNAEALQREFDVQFPLVCTNAERVAFDRDSFDLAVSEYGASLWCDPRRWLREAARLLRPEGRLIFITSSALLVTCTPIEGGIAQDRLVRDYFPRYRVEFERGGPIEFHLTHGNWVRMLRATGFVVDDLIEAQADPRARPRYDVVSREWARRWPSEDIWVAHKAG
jgi:SAM-dependent methyltransferase